MLDQHRPSGDILGCPVRERPTSVGDDGRRLGCGRADQLGAISLAQVHHSASTCRLDLSLTLDRGLPRSAWMLCGRSCARILGSTRLRRITMSVWTRAAMSGGCILMGVAAAVSLAPIGLAQA